MKREGERRGRDHGMREGWGSGGVGVCGVVVVVVVVGGVEEKRSSSSGVNIERPKDQKTTKRRQVLTLLNLVFGPLWV